uniref:Reticulon n=1 Tax=Echeneis naucrates TaxID=173247 RepID=A0A665TRE9_ECHNA
MKNKIPHPTHQDLTGNTDDLHTVPLFCLLINHPVCPPCVAVVDLVYWRNMRRTGVVFTGLVIGLASMFQLSAITVLSHICLGVMCVTFSLRFYYKLLELLRFNPGMHPFQSQLDYDSSLTDKDTVMLVEELVLLIAFAVTEVKRLLFIESLIDSIKFVILLYLLTYVGVLTNGLTLVITGEFLSVYNLVRPSPVSAPAPKPAPAAAAKQKAKSK